MNLNHAPFRTASGRVLDLSLPNPDVIELEDIASHLSQLARFNGATREFYSVASHCVYVAERLYEAHGFSYSIACAGLLHDAAEAYVGDMTSGLKKLFPDYRELERGWHRAVQFRFGVEFVASKLVHEADLRARLAETRDLFDGFPPAGDLGWPTPLEAYAAPVVSQTPADGEWAFLAMAKKLGVR